MIKQKHNLHDGRKILTDDAADKSLISKYTNSSHDSTSRKQPDQKTGGASK